MKTRKTFSIYMKKYQFPQYTKLFFKKKLIRKRSRPSLTGNLQVL